MVLLKNIYNQRNNRIQRALSIYFYYFRLCTFNKTLQLQYQKFMHFLWWTWSIIDIIRSLPRISLSIVTYSSNFMAAFDSRKGLRSIQRFVEIPRWCTRHSWCLWGSCPCWKDKKRLSSRLFKIFWRFRKIINCCWTQFWSLGMDS